MSSPEAPTESACAQLTLSRTDTADAQQRQVYVRVDRGQSHKLRFGETVTLNVAAGDHVLRANNTLFWKRVPFSIEPGQHVEFALINRAGLAGFGLLSLIGVGLLTLSIERRLISRRNSLK